MTHRHLRLILAAVVLAGVASWTVTAASQGAAALTPQPLSSPTGANAAQPQLSVSSRGVQATDIQDSKSQRAEQLSVAQGSYGRKLVTV